MTLAALAGLRDFAGAALTAEDRQRVSSMIAASRNDPIAMEMVDAEANLTRLERAAGLN